MQLDIGSNATNGAAIVREAAVDATRLMEEALTLLDAADESLAAARLQQAIDSIGRG